MSNRLVRLSALVGSFLVAGVAHAGPTGLYLMPIADTLKHLEVAATVGLSGTEHNISSGYSYFNSVTVGVADRLEVGYDSDFMGSISGNVKVKLFENPKQFKNLALSAGVMNWRGDSVDPYLVGRFDGKGYRVHAGVWRTEGTGRLMLGSDFPAAQNTTGSIEFLSGPHSQFWGSLFYSVPQIPGLGIQVAVGVPSEHADGIQHAALLYYSFKLH